MSKLEDHHRDVFENAFSSTSHWGEELTFYPAGVKADKIFFNGCVDKAGLIGSNEVEGDGKSLVSAQGRSERRSCLFEIPKEGRNTNDEVVSIDIKFPQNDLRPDQIVEEDGTIWNVKRLIGEDSGSRTILGVIKKDGVRRSRRING